MAAYAALVSLINNIQQIMKHPRLSTSLDDKQIQPLLKKADSLLAFMEKNNYGGGSKEAEDLEREIAAAAHAAEDVIESHLVDQIHAGTSEPSPRCSLDLQQKTQDMDAVLEKANEFKGKHGSREEIHSTPVMEIGETTTMVGLDEELKQLVQELTGDQSSRHTISIVGMGGTGKTTLAKNIFQHPLIKEHFHCRAWATISQQHNAQEILSQLLSGLGKSTNGSVGDLGKSTNESVGDLGKSTNGSVGDLGKSTNESVGDLGKLGLELHQNLTGRRYLIILDDIWTVEAWNEVRRFFPDNKNGSRVVLTTRLSNVSNDCGSSSSFDMKFLDEDKSWKLFCEKAFQNEACHQELKEVGKEIVRLCKGLALTIVVIGGILLNSPRTLGYWKGVVRDMRSASDSKEKEESLGVLALSFTHLPPHLKPCFLYMGVFKEDSEIHVSNVVQLWVAEGFIKTNGCQVLEEIAEGYLKDLIDRNLILVGRRRGNGKIKCCGIHDLLRDLCLKVSEQQHFLRVINRSGDIRGTERRLVCDELGSNEGGIPLARSIITWDIKGKSVKYRLLRILVQKKFLYIDSSVAKLYESVNLRYLAYELPTQYGPTAYNSPWKLPTSVSLIWNLQTLIIGGHEEVDAPTEIWKMRQLRHVKCKSGICLPPRDGQDKLLILDNLRTLKTVVNFRLSEEACEIIPNITKLHLRYNCGLFGCDDSMIEHLCNLDQLHKLESLNLSINYSTRPSPDTRLENKLIRFPSSLNKLSLWHCGFEWEDLTMIGSLPQLEVLMLENDSVRGRKWSPVDGEFLHLKFLKIECLDLKHWNAERSHFPVLEKLVLVRCYQLKEIPLDIGEIPTLQLIRVDRCNVEVAVSAVKIKEAQIENLGNDGALEVQVIMIESSEPSLRERVSIHNIQYESIPWIVIKAGRYGRNRLDSRCSIFNCFLFHSQ